MDEEAASARLAPRHRALPTVRQVCILGQLLQLPAEVGGFIHALLLGNLEDHVFFQQLLYSLLIRVPVLAQEEGRSENVAGGGGTLWTGPGPRAFTLIPRG